MNIALFSILFFVFLIPGILFRRFYFTAEFSKEYFKSSYFELLLSTFLPATLFHLLGGTIIYVFFGYEFDYSLFIELTEKKVSAISLIQKSSIFKAIIYNLVICVLASILGYRLKQLIRKYKLDRKYKLLRYKNEWHYLVTGEILDFPNVPGEASTVDFVWVDLLVQTTEGTIIYTGVLSDYVLSKENGLDRIYLGEVVRRYLSDDGNKKRKEYAMPGNFMVFPFGNVINMNLTYYQIEDDDING